MKYNFKPVLRLSQEIIRRSQKAGYEKGLTYGNFYIASVLGEIGKYKESIRYLEKSQAFKKYLKGDPMQSSRNYGLLGDNYLSLGLYSLCEKNYRLTINKLKSIKNRDQVIVRTESSTYLTLGELYRELKIYDSVYYYINKGKNLIKNINAENIAIEKNLIDIDLGNYYLDTKKPDSAYYYFNKAISEDKDEFPVKIYAYQGLGELYLNQKKYEDAERSFLKSLSIVNKHHYPVDYSHLYQNISLTYGLLGEREKSKQYLELYSNYTDSTRVAETIERDRVISEVLKLEKQTLQQENEKIITNILILGMLFTLVCSIFAFYAFSKKKEKLLKEQETIVLIKEGENKELKQKLNLAFDEILNMAKANDPAFWTRFQEVYPEFKNKMYAAGSDLKVNDLTFCAYLYLGFSSKEISEYTFKALKTIENYRYNIRKKLSLLPDQDLATSIKSIVEKK